VTPLKVFAAGVSGLLLIPVLVFGAFAGGLGSASSDAVVTTGDVSELARAVLSDPAIHLTTKARADVLAGIVDARVLQVLLLVAQTHELSLVGPLVTGHSHYVKGTTRVSNHVFGRAVDIMAIDGSPVSQSNASAREVIAEILAFSAPLTPDEVGGPWIIRVGTRSSFTNADHQDHIHVGYDR
jgi:hypothetical protein